MRSTANAIMKVTSIYKPLWRCSHRVFCSTSFVCCDSHVQSLWELQFHSMMSIRTVFAKTCYGLVFWGRPARWNKFWTSILQWTHNSLEQLSEVFFFIFIGVLIWLKTISNLFFKSVFSIFKLCLSFFESMFSSFNFFFSLDNLRKHFPTLIIKSSEGWLTNIFTQDDLLFWVELQFFGNQFMLFIEDTNETYTHLPVCFFHFMQL